MRLLKSGNFFSSGWSRTWDRWSLKVSFATGLGAVAAVWTETLTSGSKLFFGITPRSIRSLGGLIFGGVLSFGFRRGLDLVALGLWSPDLGSLGLLGGFRDISGDGLGLDSSGLVELELKEVLDCDDEELCRANLGLSLGLALHPTRGLYGAVEFLGGLTFGLESSGLGPELFLGDGGVLSLRLSDWSSSKERLLLEDERLRRFSFICWLNLFKFSITLDGSGCSCVGNSG